LHQNFASYQHAICHESDGLTTYPNLITPTRFGEIAYPLDAMIIAFLKDFEEPDNQTRCSEHQNFKVHVNRWPSPNLPSGSTGETSSRAEGALLSTLNSRNPGRNISSSHSEWTR
jgi:hypothetical protein